MALQRGVEAARTSLKVEMTTTPSEINPAAIKHGAAEKHTPMMHRYFYL